MDRLNNFRTLWLRTVSWGVALLGLLGAMPSSAYDVPKLNTLYNFAPADYPHIGNFELSPLLQASDGDLYGVSAYGGVNDLGYIYKVSRPTGEITHLHDFGFTDGAIPRGALIQATDGYLYGTTESGGVNQSDYCFAGKFYNEGGCGTVFRIGLDGRFTKLHDFYAPDDGYQSSPASGVVQAGDGNFYGMAMRPYPTTTTSLFRMTSDGSVGVFHLFATDSSEGYLSYAGLLKGSASELYGTTSSAGAIAGNATGGCGTVFKAGLDGSFQLLHVFTGAPQSGVGDGCVPWATLVQAKNGSLYGTTNYGGYQKGNCIGGGCGVIYRITPSGTESILHRFTASAVDGEYPQNDGLVQTPDGTLYGATGGNPYGDGFGFVPLCYVGSGTTFSCGTLYKIDTADRFTQLAVFGNSDGSYGLFPHASPILASDGNLYGATFAGGGWGYGTAYRLVLNPATPILSIDSFTPAGGPTGTRVMLAGTGFTGTTQLTFGSGAAALPAPFVVVSDSVVSALVPAGAQTSALGVTAPRGTTYSPVLFYLQPEIDSITPSSGRVGTGVTLLGAHFDGITSIVFGGGAPATKYTYVTSGDAAIDVIVPPGAKSGAIVVTNPGGSTRSPTFAVKRALGNSADPHPATTVTGVGSALESDREPILCAPTATKPREAASTPTGGCGPMRANMR
jgi:uncharacterized repeat protein (TIGR03803 family)